MALVTLSRQKGLIVIKILAVHRQTIKIIKWVAVPLCMLLLISLALLFADVIKADLSWDDGTRLSPVFALFLLGVGFLVSAYGIILSFLMAMKMIFSSAEKELND